MNKLHKENRFGNKQPKPLPVLSRLYIWGIAVLLLMGVTGGLSCRKAFVTNPSSSLNSSDIQAGNPTQALLDGIYRSMRSLFTQNHNSLGSSAIGLATDLMAGDVGLVNRNQFTGLYSYGSSTFVQSGWAAGAWNFLYTIISNANLVINTEGVAPEQRAQGFALRAYAYYHLINLFANWKKDSTTKVIPITLQVTIDPPPLASPKEIYDQIDKDLNEALNEFRKAQRFARINKSYIDSFVAHGLLARSYLFRGKLKQAKEEAMLALGKSGGSLDGSDLMDTTAFRRGFNDINNVEWMWGLPVNSTQLEFYTSFASHMDPTISGYAGIQGAMFMSVTLFDSMNATDIRKRVVVPRKAAKLSIQDFDLVTLKFRDVISTWAQAEDYKQRRNNKSRLVPTWMNAYPLMRKAEMYLIAAECMTGTNGGNCNGSSNNCPLHCLRKKRMNSSSVNCSGNCNRDTVIKERRRELWGEGFALYDIKRLGRPVQRDSSHEQTLQKTINRGVLFVSAGSDSLTFYIPQTVLNTNPNYNGLQPIKK